MVKENEIGRNQLRNDKIKTAETIVIYLTKARNISINSVLNQESTFELVYYSLEEYTQTHPPRKTL